MPSRFLSRRQCRLSKETAIIKLLQKYITAFPNAKMPDGAWAIYARALSPLSIEEINAAMLKLLRTLKFWPSVAEIFEAAKSVREYAEGSALPTAADAWGEVMRLVDRCHMYQPWTYSCPEVQMAAERFGKYELCALLQSEVSIARAQFMRMYNEIVGRRKDNRENEAVLQTLPKSKKVLAKVVEIAEAKRA